MRREQRNDSLKTLVGFLDHGVLETLAKIKGVTKDSELSDTEKVQRISALLANNHTAESLDPDQIDELKAAMITELSEDDYYLILASKSVRLQNRVSPILKAVTFLAEPSARELRQAIEYFKLKDGAIDNSSPRSNSRKRPPRTSSAGSIPIPSNTACTRPSRPSGSP